MGDNLARPEAQAELLADAFATGEPAYIASAFGVIARAQGMAQVAREAGVTREALYKALSPGGDPKLSTLLGVARALGIQLSAHTTPKCPTARRKMKKASSTLRRRPKPPRNFRACQADAPSA